ncbi:sulfatase-like hydrolase/transferase [Accumulibacter sp.]|uniref:sulfatase-like hydrolase/transferase n=1 Tax=Accumulibacter sp. TaxID=2053492 RepID=UPI0035B024CC
MTQIQRALRRFFVVMFVFLCLLLVQYWPFIEASEASVFLFAALSSLADAAIFVAPVVVIGLLLERVFRPRAGPCPRWKAMLVYGPVWLLSLLVVLLLFIDLQLFKLYEYHINAFVWNLVTTPGGLAALGASEQTIHTLVALVVVAAVVLAVLLAALHRFAARAPAGPGRFAHRRAASLTALLLVTLFVTEGVYAFSAYTGKESYLQAASVLPFHLNTSATALLRRLGVAPAEKSNTLKLAKGKVSYPLQPITTTAKERYPNIIWLTAESFRWDLFNAEVTPNLWAFAQQSMSFKHHYSGGNRTRMGLFSMFYGLHAPYWYSFQEQRVRPVLIDLLIDKGYLFSLRTSQSFTYPELNDTVFADMPAGTLMQALSDGEPWRRDQQNVDNMLTELAGADGARPRFMFMFFEATHAPYTFPESAVIRPDYLHEVNYAKLDLLTNVDAIHQRYINAAHFVDAQVGRLLDYLQANHQLDNTVVLFTGDHGEEFMENGHWGHGHGNYFPEEQIRVPLVLHLPGYPAKSYEHVTSHLQIPLTLMDYMGVSTPAQAYTLAGDLFHSEDFLVLGNYNYMGIKNGDSKLVFPFTGSEFFRYDVYDRQDKRLPRDQRQPVIDANGAVLKRVIAESRRFVQ